MTVFRSFLDVRYCALLVGSLQLVWAILGAETQPIMWTAVSMTVGFLLAVSSVVKWRGMLLTTEALNCFVWLAGFAAVYHRGLAPDIAVMPILGVVSMMALVREVSIGVRVRATRED